MEVKNNTMQIKHLPYGGTLTPGKNEIPKEVIEENKGHSGFEADIEAGRIEIEKDENEETDILIGYEGNDEYPKQTKKNSPWFELSNGEKVNGYENAIEAQKELDAQNE